MKRQGVLWTILSAVLFGMNPLISRSIYALGGDPLGVSWGRLFFTAAGMGAFYLLTVKKSLGVSGEELLKLFICAQGYSFTPLLLYASYNYMDSGLATTVHFTYPVLVLLGCMIFLRRRMSRVKRLSCALCFAGIVLLGNSGASFRPLGFFIAFLSAVAFAFYIIYLDGSGLQVMHPVKMAFWLSLIGAAEMLPVVVLTRSGFWYLPAKGIALTALFGLVSGCLASTLFQIGTKYIGASSASMLSTFEPITSIIIGVMVYHEKVGVRSLLGIACILTAVLAVAWIELQADSPDAAFDTTNVSKK